MAHFLIKSIFISYLFFILPGSKGNGQSLPSPLHTGLWTKFSVTEDGIYKISYTQLKSAGFDLSSTDPRQFRLYGYENGMLPQSNAAPRKRGLQEIAITIVGEDDGVFNATDYILFYGQSPDKKRYDTKKNTIYYENHLYSNKSFYFLTIGHSKGKRVTSRSTLEGVHPVISTYNHFLYYEKDIYNRLHSGRYWFGERFDPLYKLVLSFDVPGLIDGAPLQIVSSVMAESQKTSSFQLMLNGVSLADQTLEPISGSLFGLKGRQRTDTLSIDNPPLNTATAQQKFTYTFNTSNPSDIATGYLDFLFVLVERKLSLYGDQTSFASFACLSNPTGTFKITAFPKNGMIWDTTNPFTCVNQTYMRKEGNAVFSTQTTYLKSFIVANTDRLKIPLFEGKVPNQDLLIDLSADLLIVAHPLFKEQADRLAKHRHNQQDLHVKVVTTEQVYNDYSGGKQDPTAIRDLAKEMHKTKLKNLLLFGRSSYDFRNLAHAEGVNSNYVPTYESKNVLNPLETYASDDYFALLEPREGDWEEDPVPVNHTLDIGVGRLPVKTSEEAKTVVNKLIAYDTDKQGMGDWRQKIVFVADDGDRNIHQYSADTFAEDIEKNHPAFNLQKIYLDAFEQVSKPQGQVSPKARKALKTVLKKGALIVNFIGHGSEKVWTQERILDASLIDEWDCATPSYPLLITATCDFGRNDDPSIISSGEKTLIKKNGGSIALITATRLSRASTNTLLVRSFYNTLFKAIAKNNQSTDIGTLFYKTKNSSTNSTFKVSNRNLSLLGDPSMQLVIPTKQAVATYIKTKNGSDTLKALSRVTVKGEVRWQGTKDSSFNGTLQVVVKDKPFLSHTLEDAVDNNIPFTYKVRSSTLFRGQAFVIDGMFELNFVMPKNTAPPIGHGKISLYAISNDHQSNASGGTAHFNVGGKEANVPADFSPPQIHLFINDKSFTDGGITPSNLEFIAELSDQSGINLSDYGDSKSPVITLDGTKIADVEEYYLAAKDNFKKGTIRIPFSKLAKGNHTIELVVWDVYHNVASATLNFKVVQDRQIIIGTLFNYPNPFSTTTRIQFTHNRPGDHLTASLLLFDPLGKVIEQHEYDLPNSSHTVDLPALNKNSVGKIKLISGNVYLLRLIVRSLSNETIDQKLVRIMTSP